MLRTHTDLDKWEIWSGKKRYYSKEQDKFAMPSKNFKVRENQYGQQFCKRGSRDYYGALAEHMS